MKNKILLIFAINIFAYIFISMAGIILTLEFQNIIQPINLFSKIFLSFFWVLGMIIVILNSMRVNWSFMEGW